MKVLIIPIFALLTTAMLLYYRRSIKLLVYRLFYGEYHINYLELFYNEDNYESNYYPSKSSLFNQIAEMNLAIEFQHKASTKLPLYFQNLEYGISSKKLVSLIGRPMAYDVNSLGKEKIVSLVYNLEPNNVVDKYVYHFRDDKYYLGEFHFNKIQDKVQHDIIDSINLKYRTKYSGKEDFVIKNSNGNVLHYSDKGFKIIISYFNTNMSDVQQLIAYLEEYRNKKRAEYTYAPNLSQVSF